jgi:hypothetical protein
VEELLSQLPQDMIESEFNKEDPGRAPLPPSLSFALRLQGGHFNGLQQQGVHEAKVCVVFEAVEVCIVILWVRTLCSLTGGYLPGCCRQLRYSEMLGISLQDYVIPQPTRS